MVGERGDQRPDARRVTSKRSGIRPCLGDLDAGQRAGASGARPSKLTSTVCAPRWRSSASVPWSTSRPSAKDPNPVADRLDLAEDVRGQEDRLAALLGLAHRLAERHLHQRIEAAGRLVEDQQLRAARERGDQLHLLAVAVRERPYLLVRVELEALDQQPR